MQKQVLEEIVDLMGVYSNCHNTVLGKKFNPSIDYDYAEKQLSELNTNLNKFSDKAHDLKYLKEFLNSFSHDVTSLLVIVNGLSKKANNRGKYGFFEYRRDYKEYMQLRSLFQNYSQ